MTPISKPKIIDTIHPKGKINKAIAITLKPIKEAIALRT